MVYDKLLSQVVDLPQQSALLGHFLLAKKVEDRSPRTIEWYQEALGAFERFCSTQGFIFEPTKINPLHIRIWLACIQDTGVSKVTINNRFRALRVSEAMDMVEEFVNQATEPLGQARIVAKVYVHMTISSIY